MICPNCNNEIKDGNVYCEHCGFEIQFVPEFEPVIDHAIEDSISNLVESTFMDQPDSSKSDEDGSENLHPDVDSDKVIKPEDMGDTIDLSKRWKLLQTKDLSQIVEEEKKDKSLLEEEKRNKRRIRWHILIPILFGALVAGVVVAYALFMYRQYIETTPNALIVKADSAYHEGEFSEAEDYYRLILDKEPIHYDARLGLARCLRKQNKLEDARIAYEELIADQPNEVLYEELIEIYEAQNDYESINILIRNCDDEALYHKFSGYIAEPPVFSEEEGTYENEVVLKIMSEKSGDIYYTMDGSEPNASSIHYDTPIKLENGKYVVRAVFVNELGILSDSIAGVYEIHAALPDLPEIKPASGKYLHTEYIFATCQQGYDIYYTTDGTMPDEDSSKYEGPLLMNLGTSEYKFVCIDKQGKRSDIASVSYDLECEVMCTETDAINCILASVALLGQTCDLLGTSADGTGKYEYRTDGLIPYQGSDYYLVEEMFQNTGSDESRSTGKFYAIDTKLGLLFVAKKTDDGVYALVPFG